MTRIKYIQKDSCLISAKCFSTKEDKELVYAEINPKTFACTLYATNGGGLDRRINLGAITQSVFGSSLNDCKKKIKSLLISRGVSFDVEVRNKEKSISRTE